MRVAICRLKSLSRIIISDVIVAAILIKTILLNKYSVFKVIGEVQPLIRKHVEMLNLRS